MPLPAALAAKLAKRGIITPKQKPDSAPKKKKDFKGFSICPNKNNIFHECTAWCETHWKGFSIPDPQYARNVHKLLAKYPLPNHWTEIFDRGIGRYYYWDMETDMVSWLPPKHPKAGLSKSAAKLREEYITKKKDPKLMTTDKKETTEKPSETREKEINRLEDKEKERDRTRNRDDLDGERRHSDRRERDRERDERERRSKREKDDRYRTSKRPRSDALDPMDPAAYSDIPRGGWSDGLETNKGRADNTASGVLYQQRPYPAPGAVLAANRERQEKS